MKKPSPRAFRALRTLAAVALLAGCTPPEPPKPPPPAPKPPPPAPTVVVAPKPPEREAPPESGPPRELTLPAPAWDELANGLKVATIASPALPIVQIRVVALAGSSADGATPGLAALTGDLLKDGGSGSMTSREVLTRVESLGATLEVSTGFDRTVLSISVTKDQFAEALDLVSTVALKPAMSAAEFTKLKKREVDEAADRARTDATWASQMMLYKSLFGSPTGAPAPTPTPAHDGAASGAKPRAPAEHPYAAYAATAADLGKLTSADCRAFHKKHFVARNMFVVVAGDVTHDEAKAAVDKAFSGAPAGEPPALTFPAPAPPDHLQITLVDRKKSTQSDVYAGVFALPRASASWPAFAAANQVLGGGVAGRLFLDVREKQSLAYRANSFFQELAHGPSLLVAYVGTQSAKTGVAVKALLDQLERLGTTEPSADEVSTATRFLADVSALRLETVGALANDLVRNRTLGLPDDYAAQFRKQIREIKAGDAAKAVAEHVRAGHAALVVAGDAKVIGPMLSHFGEVRVVDPTKTFAVTETIPKNAEAALEAPEESGK